ncbi:MAG: MTH1187 family thiamine-binding protein [Candidatus Thermoplasmatota archaeon]|nr:MTH1187 family thiamine-binding protein [Candidatus Thermoplasmatota archaeon]MDI6856374.1 MTH1187 family thiamine-binding protein [Candidatus Thermoplasmatota archaeon]
MIIAQLSIAPIGEGTGVSKYVKASIEALKRKACRAEPTAMCTVFEAKTLDEILEALKEAHNAVFKLGAKRVITHLVIDDRKDKEASIESKLSAIMK